MAYIYFNPNPKGKHVTDCTVRMLCRLENFSWLEAFDRLVDISRREYRMPSSDKNWETILSAFGYRKYMLPPSVPDWYTIRDFCHDHPKGNYAIKTTGHVVAVVDGDYYDSFDSGDKEPMYYLVKE